MCPDEPRSTAGRRLEARYCAFDFIEECARCALMSHDPRAWWAIRAIRKGKQRSVKTSGEPGGTVDLWYGALGSRRVVESLAGGNVDLWYGTLGCWASAGSEVLFDLLYRRMCSMCPDEPRSTGLVRYPRHKEKRATICQDEWRAWRHRGLVVWDAGMLGFG